MKKEAASATFVMWMSVGTSLGTTFGLLFDNLALGMSLGVSMGVSIGLLMSPRSRLGSTGDDPPE